MSEEAMRRALVRQQFSEKGRSQLKRTGETVEMEKMMLFPRILQILKITLCWDWVLNTKVEDTNNGENFFLKK